MKKKWRSWLLFAMPYLLIVLLPVISVLFLGRNVLTDYQEKIITEKQNSLGIAIDRTLQKLESVESTARLLGSSEIMKRYAFNCLNHTGHSSLDYYQLKEFITETVANPVIYDIFLLDCKDNAVISTQTAVGNTDVFFSYTYMVEGLTPEESLARLAQMPLSQKYCPAVTITLPGGLEVNPKTVVEYRLLLPIGLVSANQSQLIITMDTQELFRDFQETVSADGEFYVYDSRDQLIYGSGSQYEDLLPLTAEKTLQQIDVAGTTLHGAVIRSATGSWKVKVYLPSLLETEGIHLTPAILAFVVLPMIACMLLTIVFTHKNYRGILELVNLFRSHAGEHHKEPEIVDYRLVQQYAGQVIAEKNRMTQQINEYSYSRKYEVLDKLVRNTYQSREEALRALEETDLTIRDGRNAVLCVCCPADIFDTLLSGGHTVRKTVRRLVSELLERPYVLFDTSAREITCVISLEEGESVDFLVQGIVSHLNVEMAYRYGIEILVGAGNPAQSIHRLGDSLEQARAVIRYRELSGNHVSLYSELMGLEDLYYYPREYDEKILDYVVAGKKDDAIALVRRIYADHFEKEGSMPSVRAINAIKSRLWDCIVSIAERYGIPQEEMDTTDQGQSIARIRGEMSARRYFALICEKIDLLSEKIQEKKASGQNSLGKRILDYVLENYCDNKLSLKQISEALGVHENYISNLFKTAYGENLSSYVEKLRIEKACELILSSTVKIEEIAGNVGYTSGASFRRAFKKVKGISPAEYRDK